MSETSEDYAVDVKQDYAIPYQPGAEARGVAWMDLYGKTEGVNGQSKTIKISLTSRSDISPIDALDALMDAVRYAKDKYNLKP